MAIKNYICERCNHSLVCKVNDKVIVFHEEAKKPLDVDITIDYCKNYEPVNKVEE
jgi:hypothetical protein